MGVTPSRPLPQGSRGCPPSPALASVCKSHLGKGHLHKGHPFIGKSPLLISVSSSAPPWGLGKTLRIRLEWNKTIWALTCCRPPMGPWKGMQLCTCHIYLYIHMIRRRVLASLHSITGFCICKREVNDNSRDVSSSPNS